MAADGTIDFDVQVDSGSITEDTTKLVTQLEKAFQNASRLRTEFRAMNEEFRNHEAAKAAKLESMIDSLTKQIPLNAASRNGGTMRDDQLKNQLVQNLTTQINTSMEQVQARLADAATKATERLIKTTTDAIQARLTKLNVSTQNDIATFGNADFVQAKMNQNRIAAQRTIRDYGIYGSLDEKEAAEAAKRASDAMRRQRETDNQYLLGLKTKYFTDEQKGQERQSAMLFNIQKATAERLEKERVAEEKRKEDLQWASFRRTSALMLQQQREEEKISKTESTASALARKERERKEYLDSPQARANALENRMKIFADYATIGLSVLAIRSMISTVITLEDEFKKFQAITQTTDTEMGSFKDQLLKVGEASRYSLKDLTETAIVLGQTGLSAEAVAKTIPAITNLATASGSSLKEATDVVTAAMGAYNMQASQASDVADTMTAALNRTKLNMTQLAQGISVSANIARDAGVSFNELTSIVASLAQAGVRSGSTIGTGTRQLIQELEAPSDKLKTLLTALGISLKDVDIKSQGLIGVLENLREKGFGTSEALRALDLRAAAAFSALTGRLDRVKQLQEALLLTSASTDGAAKAGESLSATWQRTMNVATELAVKGFDPVIEGLKGFVTVVGEVLKGMNMLGFAIPVVTSSLVAFGSALALRQIANIGVGILTIAPAAMQAAGSVTALTTALTFLQGLPLFAVAGVVAGGILAAMLFGSGDTLEKKLDRVTAVINDLQSRQSQTEATITGLDRGVDNLLNKKEKLNEDPLLRRVTIIEMQKQFTDLGGMVSAGAEKIDDLIEAMRRLRAEMAQQLPGNFAAQMDALVKQIDIKKQLVTSAGGDPVTKLAGIFGFSRFNAAENVNNALSSRLGGDYSGLLNLLFTSGEGLDPVAARAQGGAYTLQLNRARTSLLARKDKGENVDTDLAAVDQLASSLSDKLRKINDLQSDVLRYEQLGRDKRVSELQSTTYYQDLVGMRDSAYNRLRGGMNDINSAVGLSGNDKEARFIALRQFVKNEVAGIDEQVKIFEGSMELAGYSKDDIKNALSALRQDLEGIRKGTAQGIAEAHKQITLMNLQRDQKANQAEIQATVAAINENSSTADVEVAQKRVEAFLKKDRDLQIKMIEAKSDNAGQLNTQELEAVNDVNREFDAKMKQNAEQMNERRKKIGDRLLNFEQQVLKAREQKLSQDVASMEKELARPSTTSERARELRQKIDEMIEQAKGLVQQQMDLQIRRDTRGLPNDYTSNGSATGIAASIISGVQGANQSSLLRYMLGLGNAESGFNAKADNGFAKGLFQFSTDTWNALGGGDIFSVQDQIKNALKLALRDMGTFRGRMGRGASDSELYVMHQQGQDGGLALMDPANAGRSALDVLSTIYGDRNRARKAITGNGGREDMTAAEFVQSIRDYFETKAGVAGKYLTSADGAARTRAEEQRQREDAAYNDRKVAARERELKIIYDEQTFRENAKKRANEDAIRTDQLLIKKTTDAGDAERLAIGITGSLKGLMDQEIKRYIENPDNRNQSPADREANLKGIRERYGIRATETAVGNSDTIAKKAVQAQEKVVADLKLELAELERIGGNANGADIMAKNQQLVLAERKLEVETRISALQKEQALLAQQDVAIEQAGMEGGEARTRLKERQLQIEQELSRLQKRKEVQDAGDAAFGSVDKAISTGSYNFFKQAGMLNARGEFKSMTEELTGMWTQAMGSMSSSMSKLFVDLFSGTKKAKDAFRDFATGVIQSMMQIVSQALANQILRSIFGSNLLGTTGGTAGAAAGGGDGLFSGIGKIFGFALGGPVRMATGGAFAASNRDSVVGLFSPEEYVIRASAAKAIGRDNLDALNSLGSARVSRSLGDASARPSEKPATPHHTNVWVVSPDQVPPPSENDIIATVARDVQNRGSLRTLIKTVAAGG